MKKGFAGGAGKLGSFCRLDRVLSVFLWFEGVRELRSELTVDYTGFVEGGVGFSKGESIAGEEGLIWEAVWKGEGCWKG